MGRSPGQTGVGYEPYAVALRCTERFCQEWGTSCMLCGIELSAVNAPPPSPAASLRYELGAAS